jgi:TonB family protein
MQGVLCSMTTDTSARRRFRDRSALSFVFSMPVIICGFMLVSLDSLAATPPPLQTVQEIFKAARQDCLSDFHADDATLLDWARRADTYLGRDIRGRSIGDDWRDYLIAARARAGERGATAESGRSNPGSVRAQWDRRAKALCEYWLHAANATVHNRDLWPAFLSANNLPATTSHEPRIGELERRLLDAFKEDPGPDWTSQALILSQAYVDERSTVARGHLDNRPINYQARESQCPAPVTHGYGKPTPEIGDRSRSLEEIYPPELRRTGTEGDVILSIRVNAAGCAVEAGIAVSSGSPALDKAALQWYETASYLPAEKDGKTVDATAVLPMAFRLDSSDTKALDARIAQFNKTANEEGPSVESRLILRRTASFSGVRIPGWLAPPVTAVEGDGVFQDLMREQCPRPQTSGPQTRISRLLQRDNRSMLLIRPVGCDKPQQPMRLIVESEPIKSFAEMDYGGVEAPLPKLAQLASAFFAIAEPVGTQVAQSHAIPFDMILEYDIQLPDGYSADSPLPIRKVDLGAATLELRTEQRPDRRVILTAEFHSPQSTYSADQRSAIGQGLQRASLEQVSLKFTFDAHSQLAGGLEREALATYRAFSAAAPKDAYRHAEYAFGLQRR